MSSAPSNRSPETRLPLPPVRQGPGVLTLHAYPLSNPGKRAINEDAYLCHIHPEIPGWLDGLFVVADGIGGRQTGQIASSVAARTVRDTVLGTNRFYSQKAVRELLLEAFARADSAVHEASLHESTLVGMGTTLTIGAVAQRRLFVASLGDSRAYLHRGRRLIPVTEDDWYRAPAAEAVPDAVSDPGQMVTMVPEAVGWGNEPQPYCSDVEIGADDILLFCTDGLTETVADRAIEGVLHKNRRRLDVAARRLVELALRAQDPDNTTVVVARVDRR